MNYNLESTIEDCEFKSTDGRVCEYTKQSRYVSCKFISQDGICQYKDNVKVVLGNPKLPTYQDWLQVATKINMRNELN